MVTAARVTRRESLNICARTDPIIFCLPSEILQAIFLLLAEEYHRMRCGYPTSTIPNWVNVSYVCRHWRNVALSCPSLWTYLFITSPRWTEEMLVRSIQAPLKISIGLNGQDDEFYDKGLRFMEQVTEHVKRIQALFLWVPGIRGDVFLSKLSSRAPCLQKLRITYTASPNFSSALFQGDTPALRKLRISGSMLPWHTLKLGGLTALKLFDVSRQNVQDFLAMLRGMQALERLYIFKALVSDTDFLSSAMFDTFQKISLPRLSRIRVGTPHSAVIALLSCINIPSKAKLGIEYDVEHGLMTPADLAQLCPLLTRRFSSQTAPTIRSLIAKCVDWGLMKIVFSASERDCEAVLGSHRGCSIPLEIILPQSMQQSEDESIIGDICCAIPLANVQSAHIISPPVSSAFWKRMLGHLPGIRYLKLSHGDIPDLASVLSLAQGTENQDVYSDLGLDRVLAPALEEFELYDILFMGTLLSDDAVHQPPLDLQSLYDALASRTKSRGRVSMVLCAVDACGPDTDFDMVGR